MGRTLCNVTMDPNWRINRLLYNPYEEEVEVVPVPAPVPEDLGPLDIDPHTYAQREYNRRNAERHARGAIGMHILDQTEERIKLEAKQYQLQREHMLAEREKDMREFEAMRDKMQTAMSCKQPRRRDVMGDRHLEHVYAKHHEEEAARVRRQREIDQLEIAGVAAGARAHGIAHMREVQDRAFLNDVQRHRVAELQADRQRENDIQSLARVNQALAQQRQVQLVDKAEVTLQHFPKKGGSVGLVPARTAAPPGHRSSPKLVARATPYDDYVGLLDV